jgi:hypothetical protein
VRCRRRGELSDDLVVNLLDNGFASLDLGACGHLRPRTLLCALEHTRMLLRLDLSSCKLTSGVVYSLPRSVPHLHLLRLGGEGTAGVELQAWERLIPRVAPCQTPECWEEDRATKR